MVTPSDITGAISTKWFSSLAGAGKWLIYIMVSLIALVILWLILRYMEHNRKCTYFQVYGGDRQKLKDACADGVITEEEMKELGISIGHPKSARFKVITEKGVRMCSLILSSEKKTFFSPKKIKEIPFNMVYPDGAWLLRLAENNFVPIERPKVKDGIVFSLSEPDMDLWEESARADIRNRTQDDDFMKRQTTMMLIIMIGAFVLCGLIIWLSMSFAGKSINDVLTEVKPMTNALQDLAKNYVPPG